MYVYIYMSYGRLTTVNYITAGRRSRSAPARSTSESPTSCSVQSPSSCRRLQVVPSSRAWVDTRRCKEVVIEPLELKSYDEEELEKMARKRREAQVG